MSLATGTVSLRVALDLFCRLGTDDAEAHLHEHVGVALLVDEPLETDGATGALEVEDLDAGRDVRVLHRLGRPRGRWCRSHCRASWGRGSGDREGPAAAVRGRAALGRGAAAGEREPGGNSADGELPQGSSRILLLLSVRWVTTACSGRWRPAWPVSPLVRNELFVRCVHGPAPATRLLNWAIHPTPRRQEELMTRRLSLAGQMLALQLAIMCVVLVGVTAVSSPSRCAR